MHARGRRVGIVTDVYADGASAYAVGLEVTGGNERRWFLPWVATTFEDETAHAALPLVFVPSEQLASYVERGTRLAESGPNGLLVDTDGRFARPTPEHPVSGSLSAGTGES